MTNGDFIRSMTDEDITENFTQRNGRKQNWVYRKFQHKR